MQFTSVNPYTTQTLAAYDFIEEEKLTDVLNHANIAQQNWKEIAIEKRAALFSKLAELLKQKHEELAVLATLEMGKTLAEAKLEVLKCARGCEYYASQAAQILQPKIIIAETGKTVHTTFEPLGVVLGVFPWNFPYWQILRSVIPVVMAGNTMLVKPAPNVPQCSLAIQQLIDECGFPKGVIQVIFASTTQIEKLIASPIIKATTLTGSEQAGSAVASLSAKHIKKSVLELGGSDPFIVLDDADLDATLSQAITARFQNNGQSCIAAKRFILQQPIADLFLQKLQQKVAALVCGNPMDASTNIGPIARKDLCDKLSNQVNDALQHGANLVYQQAAVSSNGYFYPPTIINNILPNNPVFNQELFGPVISVYVVQTDAEAISLANATEFGLGASVWSKNIERAISIAKKIESGQVFINEMVKSQPSHAFGGVKKSGYGRELGEQGLLEFCNIKSLWV